MQTESVAACPLCGDDRSEVLYSRLVDRLHGTHGTWRLRRCVGCTAAYLDPRPTAQTIAEAYATYYTHDTTPGAALRKGRLQKWRQALRNGYLNGRYGYSLRPSTRLGRIVLPLLPRRRAAADRHVRELARPREGARILDVGCGNGEFLLELRAAGWIAQGIEVDERAVARARQHSLDVRQGTLEPGLFPERSFDAVTLSHVLEHLHDPSATLVLCRTILRDDGLLWLATPNLSSPGHAQFGRAWRGLEPPRHLVLFTAAALAQALERAGFGPPSFQRPASARWVYEASASLVRRRGDRLRRMALPLTVRFADARAARDYERGEELVVAARPVP